MALTDITQEDLNEISRIRRMHTYSYNEMISIINLYHKLLNPGLYLCPSCGGAIDRAFKMLVEYIDSKVEEINAIINKPPPPPNYSEWFNFFIELQKKNWNIKEKIEIDKFSEIVLHFNKEATFDWTYKIWGEKILKELYSITGNKPQKKK